MASIVTYKYIKQNPDIMEYIRRADQALEALGYTEHSFPHVERVAHTSAMILLTKLMQELKFLLTVPTLPEKQVSTVRQIITAL